jgi:hypothetical protein
LVLHYHVLWELTHVCFEHGGIQLDVGRDTPADECVDDVCITCSDSGRLGEVIDIDESGITRVRTARGVEIVDTSIVADVGPGALLLIHAGTAIAEVR